MSLCLSPSQFVSSYKTVRPNECKQLRKNPETKTKAKNKAWWFKTSEIKSSCYTVSHAFVTLLIYNNHTERKKQDIGLMVEYLLMFKEHNKIYEKVIGCNERGIPVSKLLDLVAVCCSCL